MEAIFSFCPLLLVATSISAQNCRQSYDRGKYAGTLSVTVGGLTCQRWDSQSPYTHQLTTDSKFPNDASITDAQNYCRAQVANEKVPWCYTTTSGVRWQFCDVPVCDTELWPRAFWMFSETYKGKDLSNNGHDAVLPTGQEYTTGPTGDPGGAVKVKGQITVSNSDKRLRMNGEFTWCGYIRFRSLMKYGPIFQYKDAATEGLRIWLRINNMLYMRGHGGANSSDSELKFSTFTLNKWHHLCIAYADGYNWLTVYLDLKFLLQRNVQHHNLRTGTDVGGIIIGERGGAAERLDADLSCYMLFSSHMTLTEVRRARDLCHSTSRMRLSPLVYWPLKNKLGIEPTKTGHDLTVNTDTETAVNQYGETAGAVHFNGVSLTSFLVTPIQDNKMELLKDFTISYWLWADSTSARGLIWEYVNGMHAWLHPNRDNVIFNGGVYSHTIPITTGRWIYMTHRYDKDSGAYTMLQNGKVATLQTAVGSRDFTSMTTGATINEFYLGRRKPGLGSDHTALATLSVACLQFYDHALDDVTIAYTMNTCDDRKGVRELWSNERMLNAVEQILGSSDIQGHPVWNLRTKTPKNEATTVPWHQDAAYMDKSSYNVFQVTAWIPLLDANEENGCMQVMRRAHNKGRVATHQCCHGGTWYVMLEEEEAHKTLDVDLENDIVTCPIPYGGVLLFNNITPHRSLSNFSKVTRWSLDLRWQRADLPVGFHGVKDGLLLRSSTDPDLKPDFDEWESWTRQQATYEKLSENDEEVKKNLEDEFNTDISGPWMLSWEIVHKNRHVESLGGEETWSKPV